MKENEQELKELVLEVKADIKLIDTNINRKVDNNYENLNNKLENSYENLNAKLENSYENLNDKLENYNNRNELNSKNYKNTLYVALCIIHVSLISIFSIGAWTYRSERDALVSRVTVLEQRFYDFIKE